MIIYKIINKLDPDKVYIGQTTQTLRNRWVRHLNSHSRCSYLHRAIKRYGAENFIIEQIDTANTQNELNEKEQYWIKYYDCIAPKGYNLTSGGEHPVFSEETRRKIGEIHKGKILSDETKLKIRNAKLGKYTGENNPNWGKTASEETRRKQSEAKKGKKPHNFGKKASLELRKKLSEAHKGKMTGIDSPVAKAVVCVETGQTFVSSVAAGKWCDRSNKAVNNALKKPHLRCGGYHWRYAE